MKTAVEWLIEQILQKVQNYEDGDIETKEDPFVIEYEGMTFDQIIEQAKAMEKAEKDKQYQRGFKDGSNHIKIIYNL